ncbi:hypothetical protein SLEP1_g60227 [Rubroshorea leprosula]|uniref:Uncharacterized protein n=1 Tax=Rubroshorea leprosula TaxID=152421 RepID=A0AAV5MV70_9ROSI|nr:hypothetical protein SLEP1_g60227 [Rubroshorea leprosula]
MYTMRITIIDTVWGTELSASAERLSRLDIEYYSRIGERVIRSPKYESSKAGAIPVVVVLSWGEYTGIVPTSLNRSVSKDRKSEGYVHISKSSSRHNQQERAVTRAVDDFTITQTASYSIAIDPKVTDVPVRGPVGNSSPTAIGILYVASFISSPEHYASNPESEGYTFLSVLVHSDGSDRIRTLTRNNSEEESYGELQTEDEPGVRSDTKSVVMLKPLIATSLDELSRKTFWIHPQLMVLALGESTFGNGFSKAFYRTGRRLVQFLWFGSETDVGKSKSSVFDEKRIFVELGKIAP